jgi:hypothetical protein
MEFSPLLQQNPPEVLIFNRLFDPPPHKKREKLGNALFKQSLFRDVLAVDYYRDILENDILLS